MGITLSELVENYTVGLAQLKELNAKHPHLWVERNSVGNIYLCTDPDDPSGSYLGYFNTVQGYLEMVPEHE